MKLTGGVPGDVTSESKTFKQHVSDQHIKDSVSKLKDMGIRPHLMAWIRRDKQYIEDCCSWMRSIVEASGAHSAMLDAEHDWHNGSFDVSDAVDLVAKKFEGRAFKLGITGLSAMHSTVGPLVEASDYGLGQAYSIWKPNADGHWSHNDSTEPGIEQHASWESWKQAGKYLVMGLSNYWASRPKRTVKGKTVPEMSQLESLQTCLDASVQVGAAQIAYWSLKHLRGTGSTVKERQEFTGKIMS